MTTNYTQELTGEALEAYIKARFPNHEAEAEAEAVEEEEEEEEQTMTEAEALEQYDQMLDDCYPMVKVCGYEYDPSRALKELDPIAYRVGFSDYCSSLEDDGILISYE